MTKFVVDRLIDELNKHEIIVDCFSIEASHDIDLEKYDALGIAYPVHAFNAPEIVMKFVGQLPQSNGMDTFIVHTAGEDHVSNYASSDFLIKKLRKRGYKVFYNRLIEMPSNFIVKYDAAKVSRMLARAKEDIPCIAQEIAKLTPHCMEKSRVAKTMAVLGRAEWLGARIAGKFFYAKRGCIHCKKCIDGCPNKNIIINRNSLHFKGRCGLCMRCVYQCPQNAIGIRQPLRFVRFDEWYDAKLFK